MLWYSSNINSPKRTAQTLAWLRATVMYIQTYCIHKSHDQILLLNGDENQFIKIKKLFALARRIILISFHL